MTTKFTFYDKETNTYSELTSKELNAMFLSKDNINIGEMTGCFCPPHKGHLEMMKAFVKDLRIDVLHRPKRKMRQKHNYNLYIL
jgi:hypothetical protein